MGGPTATGAAGQADIARLEAIVRERSPRLIRALTLIVLDRETAADIAQETFLQLHRHWADVAVHPDLGAWIYRVAVNRAIDHRRHLARVARVVERLGRGLGDSVATTPWEPELDFLAVLRTLPKGQRTAAALRYVGDLSVPQVAEIMGISEGTVNSHLNRARRRALRMASVYAALLIAIGAAVLGAYEGVNQLLAPHPLLVLGEGSGPSTFSDDPIVVISPDGNEVTLTGRRAQLYREIQWTREGLLAGTLVFDPALASSVTEADLSGMLGDYKSTGGLDDEANRVLELCEAGLFGSDLTVYLKTDVSVERISALEQELRAMPDSRSRTSAKTRLWLG